MTKKGLLSAVGIVIALGIVAIISWGTIDTTIHATSHAEFCGVCHSMTPMITAYEADIHGGNNPYGITAACTDCHVSHETSFKHIGGKAKKGFHDIMMTLTVDPNTIDWQAKRAERERFVYDSGCLMCHGNLKTATMGNNKSFIAHKAYFGGNTEKECVSCHEHVGHKNLANEMSAYFE